MLCARTPICPLCPDRGDAVHSFVYGCADPGQSQIWSGLIDTTYDLSFKSTSVGAFLVHTPCTLLYNYSDYAPLYCTNLWSVLLGVLATGAQGVHLGCPHISKSNRPCISESR